MKKVLKSLALIAAAAITLASCQNELQPNQPEVTVTKGKVHVEFGATSDEPQTKVTLGTNDDIKFEADWITGTDKLWIDYAWETEEDSDGDAVLSEAWNDNSFDADIVGPKDGEDHDLPADWVYTCYYPQPRVENNNLYFAFGANRDQDGATYAGQYDLMYGGAETTNSVAGKDGDEKVVFKMDRLTSIAYFHITTSGFDASEKLATATLEITEADDKIIACDEVYYVDGAIYKNGANHSSSITLNTTQPMDDIKLWYNVIPLTFKKATLTLTTDKGKYITLNMGDGVKEFGYMPGELQKAKIGPIPVSAFTAPEPPAPTEATYTLTFTKLTSSVTNYNSYTAAHAYTCDNIGWSIYGNQSMDGDILRFGGKNTTATDRTITSTDIIPGEVSYVVINHAGLTNGSKTKITVNSFSIEASTTSTFTQETTEKVTTTDLSLTEAGELVLNFENSHENCYYRVTMNYKVTITEGTSANNSYLTVNNIEFWLGAVTPKYDVTVSDDIVGGSVTASKAKAKEGEEVTLVPIANAGYDFTSWNVTCGSNPVSVTDNKFIMPAGDVTVSATFTAKPTYPITLTQPAVGGTISSDPATAWKGQEVTLAYEQTEEQAEKYAFKSWTVKYGPSNTPIAVSNNKFEMPASTVSATATFIPTLTVSPMNPTKKESPAGSWDFTVTTVATDWEVSVPNDQDWASVEKSNNGFTLTYTANELETESTEDRSVVITVSSEQAEKTGESAIKITFTQSGKEYIAPGTGYNLVTDASDLSAGVVIVLGCADKSKVAGALGENAYLSDQDANISEGVLTSNNAIEFTLGGSSAAWTLTSEEGQLGATAAKKMSSDPSVDNYVGTWTITIDGDGNASITSTTSGYGTIKYNASTPRFLNYASGQTDIQIYAKDDGLESRNLAFTSNADTKDIKDGTSVSVLGLTGVTDGTKTYKSSDETVAIIANDGTITLLKEGTTIISVSIPKNETYRAGSASYTLTVSDNRESCAKPTASPVAGEVEKDTEVSLSCATANHTIYYRIGTTGEFVEYSSVITIDAAKTIQAYAIADGYKQSSIASFEYTISGDVEPTTPSTKSWTLTSTSTDWTATLNETYFSQPYGYKKANGTLVNKSISAFSDKNISQIKVGFKCLQNGGTSSKLTIYLVDKNGNTLGSGVVVTPDNKSAASQTTYKYATFTTIPAGATGFMMKVTTFGKNILINGAEYEVKHSTDK